MCPLCPALLAGCGLLMVSMDAEVWSWGGLCCSTVVQVGEEADEEEEEGRGRSGGETAGLVGFSFSIMVVKSLSFSCPSQPPSVSAVGVCHSVLSLWCLYMCMRVTNMFIGTTCRQSYRSPQTSPSQVCVFPIKATKTLYFLFLCSTVLQILLDFSALPH